MPAITHTDYLQQVVGVGLQAVPGVWIRLLNNSTSTNYFSTAVTTAVGAFTHSAPPGDYSLYTGAAATVPGTPTLQNAHYAVPVTAGDDVAASSYTALASSPYTPSATIQAGWGQVVGEVTAQRPFIDITHPTYGAKGDCRWVTDAAITATLFTLTSATFAFTQADVGKVVLINGAGTAGDVFSTTIASVTNGTTAVTAAAAITTVSGANACCGTDNAISIQAAINIQQTKGGQVKVPLDTYGGKYLVVANALVPCPGTQAGGYTDATIPLLIGGDGQQSSVIVCGQDFLFTGLFGYTNSQIHAQVVMKDLTLDGNYAGVGGGVLPQVPPPSAGALFAVPFPWTKIATDIPNGWYHQLHRVRFYRAHAYAIFACHGIQLVNCVFDQVGQPDKAVGGLHLDNLGSSTGDAIVLGCEWKDSSGNYADFVDGTAGAGHLIRLIFQGNVSRNHQIGGIYACGNGSIITGNRLSNQNAGSGIGYDGSTVAGNKANNIVANNVLDNLVVNGSGLSASSFGDQVYGNVTSEAGTGITAFLQGGLNFAFGSQSIAFAASITPDFSKGPYVTVGTLTGGMTINNPTNLLGVAGQLITFKFTQDGTGTRLLAWGSVYKGNPQPVTSANAQSTLAFISDGSGNLWSITPFSVDASGNIMGASRNQSLKGLQLAVNDVGLLSSPDLTTDGTSLFIHTNAGTIYLRPTGNNQNNAFTGSTAGLWQTYDSAGAARNIIDDGSGQMVVAGNLRRARQSPTEAVLVSGVDAKLGTLIGVTITAARLVGAPLNPAVGQRLTFTFIQGGAGAFAITWNATFKKTWSDTGNATNARSSIEFEYDGTNWNQCSAQSPYV